MIIEARLGSDIFSHWYLFSFSSFPWLNLSKIYRVGPSDFVNAVSAKQGSGPGGCLSDFVNAVKAKQGSGPGGCLSDFVKAVKAKQGSGPGGCLSDFVKAVKAKQGSGQGCRFRAFVPSRPNKDLSRDAAINNSGA
jgi:uncharacterized protein YbaA (DUF1428 family)